MPIRVAIYQPVIPTYRVPFFNALAKREEIVLSLFASRKFPGCPDTLQSNYSFSYREHPSAGFLGNRLFWQSGLRIPNEFQRGDVIVICGNPRYLSNYPLIRSARKKHIGVVWWGHGKTPGGWALFFWIRRVIMRYLADVMLLYSDKEVAVYNKLGFPSDRLFGTNNTIDSSEIQNERLLWSENQMRDFQHKHDLMGKKILLFCGRITKKARLDLAIKALNILKEDKSYVLLIFGDGSLLKNMQKLANALGVSQQVKWLGAAYEQGVLAPWFMVAHLFVYPGPIGLSLFHAFAYGVPVITHGNEKNQLPEFCAIENDFNGILFREEQAIDLARKIRIYFSEPVKMGRMSKNAFATVKNDYSMSNMVGQIVTAVQEASRLALNDDRDHRRGS